MANDPEIYVIVSEYDRPIDDNITYGGEKPTPIVFEAFVDEATLSEAKERIKRLNGRYGICRIAKLEFIDMESINEQLSQQETTDERQ